MSLMGISVSFIPLVTKENLEYLMSKNKFLGQLQDVGQSIWYDNVSRSLLESGELKKLVDAGITGLTSNPTIFDNAVSGSSDYDQTIQNLFAQGLGASDILEQIMVEDISHAADLLLPVFESSSGLDGYASLEVSPLLASDTASTVAEARRLWKKLSKPNVMIKVPATKEGIPAIEQLIADGININVTLIFSVERYQEVVQAYIKGLQARNEKGLSLDTVRSVASFFISRVDALYEKKHAALIEAGSSQSTALQSELLGKVGIANSKLAYEYFESSFYGDSFAALAKAGAHVQRPLWASTGTKNPDFSPVLYVEELIGKDTVNTLPPKTLDHLMGGITVEPRVETGFDEAKNVLSKLESIPLHLAEILSELESAGVASFSKSYESALSSIEQKRSALCA